MTEVSHTASCDINNILAGYKKTGIISHLAQGGTFTNQPDALEYQEALNLMMDAQSTFDALPSEIRKEFNNNPEEMLSFTNDPENYDRMVELGMINADPEPPLPTAVPAPEAPSKPPKNPQPKPEENKTG